MSGSRYAKRTCDCGAMVFSNSGTHERACPAYLAAHGYKLQASWDEAIREHYRLARSFDATAPYGFDVIPGVERRLGDWFLERRAAGDLSTPAHREFHELVWRFADEAEAALRAERTK